MFDKSGNFVEVRKQYLFNDCLILPRPGKTQVSNSVFVELTVTDFGSKCCWQTQYGEHARVKYQSYS